MRPLASFFTVLAANIIGAGASEASIFTFGPELQGLELKPSVISSATFQQVFELRTGSSTTSTLERSDEDNLELLSRLSGPSSPLFGAPLGKGKIDTILVMLEGLSDDVDLSIRNQYRSESLTTSFQTTSKRDAFFESLLDTHLESIVGPERKSCIFHDIRETDSESGKDANFCLPTEVESQIFSRTLNGALLSQITAGESWISENRGTAVIRIAFKPAKDSGSLLASVVNSLFLELHSLSLDGKRVTAVMQPNINAMPKSYHNRRVPGFMGTDSLTDSVRNTRPIASERPAKVPLTLAPVCYASNSSCNEATNACSGHGVCYKKSGSESESASGDCYACRCYETTVKNKDGTERKVRWGGSACQKTDISSPFFLIAGVTISVALAISAAVGMIYHVGNTELPGVISAGVGSVRVQK